ncbi:hypothetical protein ACOSQ4_005516 [Xanthoceras sorbifolium]
MAAASSSSLQQSSQSLLRSASILDRPAIAKNLNFNLLIKLNRDNYVYWKTLVLPSIRALELEELITGERPCPSKFTKLVNPVTLEKESQQLQNLRKVSSSIADFVLKVKVIGDGLRSAGQVITDRDLLLSVLNGLGHDYDPVVVMITSQQHSVSLHEAQYMLMIHEQQIEHLSSISQIEVSAPTANFVAQHNSNGGKSNGRCGANTTGGRGQSNRGRRGRGGR